MNEVGVAVLRNDTLASGVHSLTASYAGDEKFSTSTSAAVSIDIASPDFSLAASPTTASVIAGQSTQFVVTVSPVGSFAKNVTLSCSPTAGITCAFSPATVATAHGAASANLTIATSAQLAARGIGFPALIRIYGILFVIVGFSFANLRSSGLKNTRVPIMAATVALSFLAGGCGGYGGKPPSPHSASVAVTAQSGAISHSTTVNVNVR